MTQYRKKPIVVDAKQWNKPGDHAAVADRVPEIVFDRAGNYFYVSHAERGLPMATRWLAVDPGSPVATTHGAVLPFAFYEVKSGDRIPAADRPWLFDRYIADQAWPHQPVAAGVVTVGPRSYDTELVSIGDWIVTHADGRVQVVAPDAFEAEYEQVHG